MPQLYEIDEYGDGGTFCFMHVFSSLSMNMPIISEAKKISFSLITLFWHNRIFFIFWIHHAKFQHKSLVKNTGNDAHFDNLVPRAHVPLGQHQQCENAGEHSQYRSCALPLQTFFKSFFDRY